MSDVAVYMVTHDRPDETCRVINALWNTSDCEFDLYVVDSGSGPIMQRMLQGLQNDGKIKWLLLSDENIGQNLGANAALDAIYEHGNYEWVVLWSPDVRPKGRRVLKKLVRAARMFKLAGAPVIVVPKVLSGELAKQVTATGDDIGFPYHAVEAAKGYVRCHPYEFLRTFRFVPFGAIGFGESLEIADLAKDTGYQYVVVENIKVRHFGGEIDEVARHFSYGL